MPTPTIEQTFLGQDNATHTIKAVKSIDGVGEVYSVLTTDGYRNGQWLAIKDFAGTWKEVTNLNGTEITPTDRYTAFDIDKTKTIK